MKLAVYAIAKDEETFVSRCVQSASDADLFVMTDTGSTDRTVEVARDLGVVVHQLSLKPFRFDVARNVSLAMIPGDVDVCVCIDMDEVLEPGWRAEIERLWQPAITRMRYLFDWGGGSFLNDKVHARHGFYWKYPCHERLVPDARCPELFVDSSRLLMRHLPDMSKSRGQYLELLQAGVAEDPQCSRSSFYLTREYGYRQMWSDVIREGLRYLSLPTAQWAAERAATMGFIGRAHENLGSLAEALLWYRKGTSTEPDRREPWVALADACHRQKKWPECLTAAAAALAIHAHRYSWPNDEVAWGEKPDDLLALSAYYMGLYPLAVYHGRKALEHKPGDARLVANMGFYLQAAAGDNPRDTVFPPLPATSG